MFVEGIEGSICCYLRSPLPATVQELVLLTVQIERDAKDDHLVTREGSTQAALPPGSAPDKAPDSTRRTAFIPRTPATYGPHGTAKCR